MDKNRTTSRSEPSVCISCPKWRQLRALPLLPRAAPLTWRQLKRMGTIPASQALKSRIIVALSGHQPHLLLPSLRMIPPLLPRLPIRTRLLSVRSILHNHQLPPPLNFRSSRTIRIRLTRAPTHPRLRPCVFQTNRPPCYCGRAPHFRILTATRRLALPPPSRRPRRP